MKRKLIGFYSKLSTSPTNEGAHSMDLTPSMIDKEPFWNVLKAKQVYYFSLSLRTSRCKSLILYIGNLLQFHWFFDQKND